MKHHTRRAIAYIAGKAISKQSANSIYDYTNSSHFHFSGNVDESVSVYDYEQSCHISGSLSSFFHYGNGGYISININGNSFSGFDYNESTHFSGNVNGSNISLFDYGASQYFNFSL